MAKKGRPKGHRLSEETKLKIAATKAGYRHDKTTKDKISATLKKYFEDNSAKIGSTTITHQGYIWIKTDDCWIPEHRYKVEQFIGRELNSCEVVHHKDLDKGNNNIWNLQIMGVSEHSALHGVLQKSKKWLITKPCGGEMEVLNLKEFCRANKLDYRCMRDVANGKVKKGNHKGFKCKKMVSFN